MGIISKLKEVKKRNDEMMKDFILTPITDKKEAREKIIDALNSLNSIEAKIGKYPEIDNAKEQLGKLAEKLKIDDWDRLVETIYKHS